VKLQNAGQTEKSKTDRQTEAKKVCRGTRRDEKGVLLGLTLGYDSFWEKTLQEELFAATL
jgi:hypothetical protein